MSVGDVVNLVGSVDGFSQRMLDDYGQRLIDNNINGTVLMSCDLAELKPVLQMAFGDWVLFHSMVESLRYSEQADEPCDVEVSPPMEVFVPSTARSTGKPGGAKSTSVPVTTAVPNSVTSSSKKVISDTTLTSVSNSDVGSLGASRSSPTLKDPPTAGDRDVTGDVKPARSGSPKDHPPLKRQDSFVSEVLMESETLRGFIQASVVGSDSEGGTPDSDDDVQRPITTIPEETTTFSRNTSESSLGRSSLRQTSVIRRMSIESGPIDRAFSVGPDQDSGESDSEVERVSRRSSIRQIPTVQSYAGTKPEADATPATSERRKKSISRSMKHSHDSHHASTKLADKSKSVSKLDRPGNECSVPLMSLYFPMAHDHSHTESQTHSESQSLSYVSPKASVPTASQISSSSASRYSESGAPGGDSDCHRSCPPVSDLSSWQHQTSSSSSGPHPQPAFSAATSMPTSGSTNHETSSQPASRLTASAESVTSDNVKFFIVDESDLSPKAIMLEMESLPPHCVTSSLTGEASTYHDPDHVAV